VRLFAGINAGRLDVGSPKIFLHLYRMLEAQLQMASEKAQIDLVMQKAEMERKVSVLVDKLRAQRFGLEVAKECLSEMNIEFSEVHNIVHEISQSMAFSDCGRSQSLGDTGEASSRGSRRSAAGTVESTEGDSAKLQSAYMRIRKLEAELAVAQERSDRILGLENEMEMYTSMQDLKIHEMQCQIRDLHTKLVAERQRNEELVSTVSSIVIERVDQKSASSSLHMPLQSGNFPHALGHDDAARNAAEFVREVASEREKAVETPVRLLPEYSSNRGYSPYNPVEGRGESGEDGEQCDVNQRGLMGRRSVSDLASKFEYRPASAVCFGNHPGPSSHTSAHLEREITNSPRPRILQSPVKTGVPSTPKPLIQKALSLFDNNQQSTGASRTSNSIDLHSSGRTQSSPARPSVATVKRSSSDADPRSACDVDPHADWISNWKSASSVAGDATAGSTLDILLAEYDGQQEESNPKSVTPHVVPRVLPLLSQSDQGVSPLHRQLLHNGE